MSDRSLVMVIGPGRSGTSSMAGALAACGFHVPGAIRGNQTNPTGFFEPRWVVNLHKRLLEKAGVGTLDPDPAAIDRIARINQSPEEQRSVREWLEARFEENPRLVLKDPRMVWFHDLWVAAADQIGVTPGFVVMVRHPAEVSSSRSTYYASRDVGAVSGWINVALLSEKLTARSPRRFVHYPDLLADWRPELAEVARLLDVSLTPSPAERPHPVDDLIDPSLRRMSDGWDDVAVPPVLVDLAERTFARLHEESRIGGSVPADAFDALRAEYAELHDFATVMTTTRSKRRNDEVRQRAARRARRQLRAELAAAAANVVPQISAKAGLVARVRDRLSRGGL